jgi:hypothetical protein
MLSDDEIRRTYRVAEALALSGFWKDITRAEGAFAKMVLGRDLGLTPAQSMQGIHIVEGGIQMHYAQLGQFIRAREGYDYRAGWIKEEPNDDADRPPVLAFVWHDEEDPLDDRPVVGAAVMFTVDGVQRGLSRYTIDDAQKAGLIKDSAKAAWNTSRRNMFLARAMSNGVKWFVPEVMGGLPVYVEGELEMGRRRSPSLTDGTTSAADEGTGINLGPAVEKIIARAERVGHRGLANRAAVELAVGNRSPGVIKDWCGRADAELDQLEAEKAAEAEPVVDAEVVEEHPEPVDATPHLSAEDVPTGPSSPVSPDPDQVAATSEGDREQQVAVLRVRLERLEAIDPQTIGSSDAEQLQEEIEHVEAQLRALGEEVQG